MSFGQNFNYLESFGGLSLRELELVSKPEEEHELGLGFQNIWILVLESAVGLF